MKLYQSPMSPYARKVRAVIIETGLDDRVQEMFQQPRENTGGFHRKNPLARIPVLETDKGEVLFDSPVICEYLDSLHKRRRLFPASPRARWAALKRQALGDGIMDAAVPLRQEQLRTDTRPSPEWLDRYKGMITRTLDTLQRDAKDGKLPKAPDIGTLSIGCALGYLDFRFPDMDWRKGRPALRKWYESFATRPSLAKTVPQQA